MSKINQGLQKIAPVTIAVAMTVTSVLPAQAAVQVASDREMGITTAVPETYAMLLGPRSTLPTVMIPEFELVFSDSATSQITRVLKGATRECRALASEYRASCAAAAFKRAASAASRPDYRAARSALNKASRDLSRLVSRNADRSAPTIGSGRKKYKAVKKAAVRAVAKQAISIISETQTKLLRSSGSVKRKTHYKRIAQAVGSTKVIFRS